jgi:hypothetical protein
MSVADALDKAEAMLNGSSQTCVQDRTPGRYRSDIEENLSTHPFLIDTRRVIFKAILQFVAHDLAGLVLSRALSGRASDTCRCRFILATRRAYVGHTESIQL